MKLAVFYEPSPGTVGDYLLRAFISLGHTVEHFPTSQAARCVGGYDVYLRIDHGSYDHDLPERLRPRAFYIVDTHLRKSWRSIQRQTPRYDILFFVQRVAAQRFRRAFWTPLGCDLEVHGAQPQAPEYDVAFIGNDGGVPRKFYLQELRERYPRSFIGKAPHTEMARIYSRAKIGFHYIECTSPLQDMISMRVYEVRAAKRLLLANALEPQDYEPLGLRNREEVVLYHNPRELFELLGYYLDHQDERERIAAAGHACVVERHTYRHRAEQMTDILHKELGVPR